MPFLKSIFLLKGIAFYTDYRPSLPAPQFIVGCEDMNRPHRIAAGGLIFKSDMVLLVRYRDANGGTYLVGPGGKLKDDENVAQAIVRETM